MSFGDDAPPDPELDALARWPAFAEAVRDRLEKGRSVYGDASFERSPDALLVELQQEALDLAGWGYVLFQRIEAMRSKLSDGSR